MKKKSLFFTALIMLFFTTTWSIKADKDSMLPSELAGKWFIKELNGKKIVIAQPFASMPFIEFDIIKKIVNSHTACNLLKLPYVASGSKLSFNMRAFFSTAVLCSQELMEVEDQIREAMCKITNFGGNKKFPKNVDLKDNNGKTLLKLER